MSSSCCNGNFLEMLDTSLGSIGARFGNGGLYSRQPCEKMRLNNKDCLLLYRTIVVAISVFTVLFWTLKSGKGKREACWKASEQVDRFGHAT